MSDAYVMSDPTTGKRYAVCGSAKVEIDPLVFDAMIVAFEAKLNELEASVGYLRKENIDWEDKYRELAARYNRLSDLTLMLHGCALGMADCDMCRRSNDGYACEYIMRELGVIE